MPALLALGWSTVDTRAADFSLLTVDADGAATPMADAVADPTVLRQVPAIADPGVLAAIAPADRLSIELFDGDVATTVCDNVTLANGGCTITGALEGEPQSSVVITARNGRMTGIIRRAGGGTYRLRATNDGVAVLTEINEQAFPGCAGGGEANVGPNNAAGNGPNNPAAADPSGGVADGGCDDGSIIDVLVVYTPLARVAAGGVAAIEAEAQLAIDASNDAYANSGMTPRLRLVHVAETSYNETGDYFAHLNQLTNASDGVMDEVQGLRDTYGADLVSLLVDDGQYCGLAWLMATESASFANFGFSVTTWYCAAGNLSFPHELGHNMGCCHDHDNCGGGVFDYSWGHRFTGATSGLTRRTVMAYAPGTRIPYFSNPDVLYEGTPTGRPEGFADEADNARTIDETADTIANFRCAVDASGTWVGPAGGRWLEPTNWGGGVVPDGTTDVTLSTGVLIDGAGATAANVTLAGGGVLLVQDSGDLTATSITIAPGGQLSVTVGTVTSPAVTVNWGAELRLGHPTADLVATNITVDANGVLTGIGTITGDVTVAGELRPGDAVGNLAIDGDCTMQAGSSVWFDVQQDGTRDLLQASGTATLAGDCFVSLPDGAAPATGTCVSVLAAGTTVGGFDGEALPYVSYAAEMVATASPGLLTVCVNAIVPPRVDGLSGSDQFGFSVANAGDVNNDGIDDFIVGAPYNDDKGTNAGRVTVCAGDTGAVLYTRKGAHPGNRFGWSVAGAGDVDRDGYADFVVGAPYYADSRGRIKVYSGRTGATLYIKKGKRTGDRFGYSVSGGVDINDDNYDDFLVGAPHNDDAGGKAGAVDVYSGRNGSTLVHLTGASSGDAFGWSVAGLGRANSDRFADFVVGAPKNDDRASNAGRVYVFSGRNYSVLYSIKGLRKGDQFGRAVAAAGRVDTDGRDDFIVGSPYNDPSGRSNAGRIDVYAGRDGDRLWAKSGQTAGDRLGWTVAGAGDVNGDGRADILAGAPWHDTGGTSTGRVYLRSGTNGATIAITDGDTAGDWLGHGLAGGGDYDGDGCAEVIYGAPKHDATAGNAGRVYVVFSTCGAPDPAPDGMTLPATAVPATVNGDSTWDASIVLAVMAAWGRCDAPCAADLDGDGWVDADDLALAYAGVDPSDAATADVVVDASATEAPDAGGFLLVRGDHTLASGDALRISVSGTAPGKEHGLLVVDGTAMLAGTLDLSVASGVAASDAIPLVVADAIDGWFDAVTGLDDGRFTLRFDETMLWLEPVGVSVSTGVTVDVNADGRRDVRDVIELIDQLGRGADHVDLDHDDAVTTNDLRVLLGGS